MTKAVDQRLVRTGESRRVAAKQKVSLYALQRLLHGALSSPTLWGKGSGAESRGRTRYHMLRYPGILIMSSGGVAGGSMGTKGRLASAKVPSVACSVQTSAKVQGKSGR